MAPTPRHIRQQVPRNRSAIKVIAVLVAAIVGIFAVSQITLAALNSGNAGSSSSSASAQAYVSPYNWTDLTRTNGRYVYSVNGTVLSRLGVDVSENQGAIDWDQVAGDGIDFAIVRLGYRGTSAGTIYLDSYFEDNVEGAAAAGLDVGVYFFSQATTVEEATEEADYVLANLNGRYLAYPVYYDCEEVAAGAGQSRTAGMTDEEMTACAKAFCERMAQGGYTAAIYGNGSDLARYNLSDLASYSIWYAEYSVPAPTIQHDFTMWQYSSNGNVAGISTAVDLDLDLTAAYTARS